MIQHRDPELWGEGGEGVVGDLGFSSRHGFEECGLPGVGESDESDFRDDLELEDELFGLAWFTWGCGSWCLVDGVFEVFVPEPASSAVCDDEGVAWSEVDDLLSGDFVMDDGACRDADDAVFRVGAGALFGTTHVAGLCFPFVDATEIDEGVETFVDAEDDVAAFASVAAVGSAFGHPFGSFEGDFAVSAVAGGDLNSCAINKHGKEGYVGNRT